MTHPYIGLHAKTKSLYREPLNPTSEPRQYEGMIAFVGTDYEEYEAGPGLFPAAVLLLEDGTHRTFPFDDLVVDYLVAKEVLDLNYERRVGA